MNKFKPVLLAGVLIVSGLAIAAAPAEASQPFKAFAPAAATVKTPPAILPWGDPVVHKTLSSTGSKAGNSTAVKGGPAKKGALSTLSTCTGACYFYNVGQATPGTGGADEVWSNGTIGKPVLASNDYHSLTEVAIQKSGTSEIATVEIGATVDRAVNSTCTPAPACKDNPFLFVYWWKNGKGQGYNNVPGWVDNAANPINAGADLSSYIGTTKKFGGMFSGGAWWMAFDTDWVGYFDETNWTGSTLGGTGYTTPVPGGFSTAGFYQTFWELAAHDSVATLNCSQMGNGVIGTAQVGPPAAARWSSTYHKLAGVLTNPVMNYFNSSNVGSPPVWTISPVSGSTRSAYGGGPKPC